MNRTARSDRGDIMTDKMENQLAREDQAALDLALTHLANVEELIGILHQDTASSLMRRIGQVYDAADKRATALEESDTSGDDLITDQQIALASDRRADAKVINGGMLR